MACRSDFSWWLVGDGREWQEVNVVNGMTSRGDQRELAEATFEQIKGFSEYDFPESHAANFALLVYASCWIRCHHPAEFLAAMLNSQPLGFYSASQLVRDSSKGCWDRNSLAGKCPRRSRSRTATECSLVHSTCEKAATNSSISLDPEPS